jgi:hypothetical protein
MLVANALSAQSRLATGRVTRPAADGHPTPVEGQWVVLHRVGSDKAAPLDSAKSGRDGRFRIRYTPFGATDALYFVSARYGGIAYFSPPLRRDTVSGGDADVIVYDTTPDTSGLRALGRHFVVSSPRSGRREVAEVFELENSGFHTVVPRDSTRPVWTVHLPAEAESVSVAPGDIAAGAVMLRKGRAELFAPLSPGVRQLVLTYLLPLKGFPLSLPLEHATSVIEVLVAEPRANVEGARLREVAPASIEGRTFRRFLAQDAAANAVVRIEIPSPVGQNPWPMRVLAVAVALAMAAALFIWFTKLRRRQVMISRPTPVAGALDILIHDLAALDANFERERDVSADRRDAYQRERAELKDRIARVLAAEKEPV